MVEMQRTKSTQSKEYVLLLKEIESMKSDIRRTSDAFDSSQKDANGKMILTKDQLRLRDNAILNLNDHNVMLALLCKVVSGSLTEHEKAEIKREYKLINEGMDEIAKKLNDDYETKAVSLEKPEVNAVKEAYEKSKDSVELRSMLENGIRQRFIFFVYEEGLGKDIEAGESKFVLVLFEQIISYKKAQTEEAEEERRRKEEEAKRIQTAAEQVVRPPEIEPKPDQQHTEEAAKPTETTLPETPIDEVDLVPHILVRKKQAVAGQARR